MKKLFTLLLITFVLGAVSFGQTVHQYAEDEMDALVHDLRGTGTATIVAGDIVELTTSGGVYVIDSLNMDISVDLTLRAASSVDVMPMVKRIAYEADDGDDDDDGPDAHVKVVGDIDVVIDGIAFMGDDLELGAKYAVKSQKWTDFGYPSSDGYEAYIDSVEKGVVPDEPMQSFNLTIQNCKIDNIDKDGQGHGVIIYPGMTAGLLKIENTTISNLSREGIKTSLDSGERGARPWSCADSIALINCTFYNMSREAILTRAENDVQDSMNITYINHCTFDNCGKGGAEDSDRVIALEYNKATVINSIISNDIGTDYAHRLRETSSFTDYMGYWMINSPDSVRVAEDYMEGPNKWGEDTLAVLYVDAASGDYTLATATFIGMADDGEVLGDMRNAPDYIAANNAYLSGITVADVAIPDFDALTYDYRVEVPFGTGVPTVVGTAVNGSTPAVQDAASLPGTTSIVVTADDGSTTRTYEVFIFEGEPDAINNVAENSISVYPNPSNGSFSISGNVNSVAIYNVTGKLVYELNTIESDQLINTDLAKGMYFIVLSSDETQHVSKLIIE